MLKRTWTQAGEDNVSLIAAGIAFYMFAAIVPSLGAVVLSYGLFADGETVRRNVEAIFAAVPREAATLISDQLLAVIASAKGKQGFGLLVAIAIAYYGATKGATAITTGLNVAYDVRETRSFVRTTLLSFGIVAGGVVLVLLAVLATTVLAFLQSLLPAAPAWALTLIRLGGYVVLATLVATAAAALFRFVPDRPDARWVWLSPGAVLATVAWLSGTALFGLYVSNFGNYGATYGSLSAVIVLLTWLWLTAYVFLLGAELNVVLDRREPAAAPVVSTPHPARHAPPLVGAAANGLIATSGFALLRRGKPIGLALVAAAAIRAWRRRPPPRGVQAVLFDIDGTLVDSNDLHVDAWQQAFAEAGHRIDHDAIHGQIGKGGDKLVPALLPDLPHRDQKALADSHDRLFKRMFLDRVPPFPGARALIERVHADGHRIVLASSASGEELDHYVRLLDIAHWVDARVTSDDVDASKPAPDIFALALRKTGLPADAAIAIGDTPYDAQAAGRSGIRTIGVLSGGFARDALVAAGTTAIYDDVADLLAHYAQSPLAAGGDR